MNIRYAFNNGLIKTRKLTKEQVEVIKYLYNKGETQASLAREFNVSPSTIWKVVNELSYQF